MKVDLPFQYRAYYKLFIKTCVKVDWENINCSKFDCSKPVF